MILLNLIYDFEGKTPKDYNRLNFRYLDKLIAKNYIEVEDKIRSEISLTKKGQFAVEVFSVFNDIDNIYIQVSRYINTKTSIIIQISLYKNGEKMRFDTELIADFFMDLASFLIFCTVIYVVLAVFFKFKHKNKSKSRNRYYSRTKYSQYNNNRNNKNNIKHRQAYNSYHKYPETYRAVDDHECKSLSEKIIDDFLFRHGIKHHTEDYINVKLRKFKYDWYLPDADVYVEFFGYQGERYNKSRREKEEFYKKLNLKMIAIEPKDLLNAGRFLKKKFQKYWSEIVDQNNRGFKADFRNMEEIGSDIKLMDETSFFDLYLLVNNEFLKRKETRDLLIKTEGKFHRNKGKGPYVARYFFNEKSGVNGKYERDFSVTKTKWLNDKIDQNTFEAEFRGSVEVGTVLEMRIKAEHQPTREKEYRIVTSNPSKILKKISWREAQKLA